MVQLTLAQSGSGDATGTASASLSASDSDDTDTYLDDLLAAGIDSEHRASCDSEWRSMPVAIQVAGMAAAAVLSP